MERQDMEILVNRHISRPPTGPLRGPAHESPVACDGCAPCSGALRLISAHEVYETRRDGNTYRGIVQAFQLGSQSLIDSLTANKGRVQGAVYSEELVRVAFRQLVRAMASLHRAGVIHRDLKTDNIMLLDKTGRGHAVETPLLLLDFGLSCLETTRGSRWGELGTRPYLAPECLAVGRDASGSLNYDPRHHDGSLVQEGCVQTAESDVWSLGCILFELLAGFTPFQKKDAPGVDLRNPALRKRIFEGAAFWSLVPAGAISESAADLIRRMLVKDPKRRPTAADVLGHPWLSTPGTAAPQPDEVLAELARARLRRLLQKSVSSIARLPFAGAPALSKLAEHHVAAAHAAQWAGVDPFIAAIGEIFNAAVGAREDQEPVDVSRPAPFLRGASAGAALYASRFSIPHEGLGGVLKAIGIDGEQVDSLLGSHNLFAVLDVDGNGRISWREFLALVPLLVGATPVGQLPVASLHLFFSLWDASRDGTLDRDELTTMLTALQIPVVASTARDDAFAAVDRGELNFELFRALISATSAPAASHKK
jgi:serine/threonine protein kinase